MTGAHYNEFAGHVVNHPGGVSRQLLPVALLFLRGIALSYSLLAHLGAIFCVFAITACSPERNKHTTVPVFT